MLYNWTKLYPIIFSECLYRYLYAVKSVYRKRLNRPVLRFIAGRLLLEPLNHIIRYRPFQTFLACAVIRISEGVYISTGLTTVDIDE